MRVDFPSRHSGARAKRGNPESTATGVRVSGFRVRRCAAPRNDGLEFLTVCVAALLAASAASAQDLKPWRHGLVEAKSDAGFIFMPAKGGFAEKQGLKIEMVQFKGDTIALKAMLAGELDTYEGSPGGPMLAAPARADT